MLFRATPTDLSSFQNEAITLSRCPTRSAFVMISFISDWDEVRRSRFFAAAPYFCFQWVLSGIGGSAWTSSNVRLFCGSIVMSVSAADLFWGRVRVSSSPITGIEKTIKKYGLKYESREMTVEEIKSSIDKEIPVIVVLQAWAKRKVNWKKDWKDGHYVVVIGYNSKGFIFEDPSSFERTSLTYGEFKKRWHDVSSEGKRYVHYGISVFGKKPKYDSKKIVKMR